MKIGDLVEYKGWSKTLSGPLAIVLAHTNTASKYHTRIRVMWLGKDIPIQANVISTSNSRISTWVHPKHFEVVGEAG